MSLSLPFPLSDVLVYLLVGEYAGLFVGLFIWAYRTRVRLIYRVDFFRVSSDSYSKIGDKEFKVSDESIKFRKKTFPINLTDACLRDKNKTILCIDFDNDKVLKFSGIGGLGDTRMRHTLLGQGILEKIVQGLHGIGTVTWVIALVFLGLAVVTYFLGLFTAEYVLPKLGINMTGGA